MLSLPSESDGRCRSNANAVLVQKKALLAAESPARLDVISFRMDQFKFQIKKR